MQQEAARINARGGVAGRRIEAAFLDDARDTKLSIANMRAALANPSTVAMVGMSNSSRAQATFEAVATDLAASRIPFLSDLSVNSIFEKFPNVFTTRASQDDERLPVMTAFAIGYVLMGDKAGKTQAASAGTSPLLPGVVASAPQVNSGSCTSRCRRLTCPRRTFGAASAPDDRSGS